jgi:hypothetical protein
VVYANGDTLKDLLVGLSDGTVKLYFNANTDEAPEFDGGAFLQVGDPGSKVNIDVGSRATPTFVDWDSDGKRDLVVGAIDGKLHVFINEGADTLPDFRTEQFVQEDPTDLVVPTARSSPHIADLDDDGKKDVLTGNTEGQLVFYSNVGTDEAPDFSGYTLVEADSVPIDLAGLARSRPFVCEWTGDGLTDVLIGGSDGKVRLYQGVGVVTGIASGESPSASGVVSPVRSYPNPFNPSVTISFALSAPRHVRLSVLDAGGRQIALLAERTFSRGPHRVRWTGLDDRGKSVSSGVYFVWLRAEDQSLVSKAVLTR